MTKILTVLLSSLLLSTYLQAQKIEINIQAKSLHVQDEILYVRTTNKTFKQVLLSNEKIKLVNFNPSKEKSRPKNILIDGIVSYGDKNIKSAWLHNATLEYAHGVLGDKVESKSLSIITDKNTLNTYTLDKGLVFEDRLARLYDINGDGKDEIFVITTNVEKGASVSMFELRNNELKQTATTGFIGTSNRWLNIAGFGDVNGNGIKDITFVITPHIGGYLTTYEYHSGSLVKIHEKYGYTNHYYGSPELGMSKVSDIDGDGIDEIIVLQKNAKIIEVINYKDNKLNILKTIKNDSKINSAIFIKDLNSDGIKEVIYTLSNGELVVYQIKN